MKEWRKTFFGEPQKSQNKEAMSGEVISEKKDEMPKANNLKENIISAIRSLF